MSRAKSIFDDRVWHMAENAGGTACGSCEAGEGRTTVVEHVNCPRCAPIAAWENGRLRGIVRAPNRPRPPSGAGWVVLGCALASGAIALLALARHWWW